MATKEQARRRWKFPYHVDVQTRWLDNDQYGHLNNSSYFLITDTVSNTYLIDHCGIEPFQHNVDQHQQRAPDGGPNSADAIGLVISSSASFFASTSFPNALRVGLRVVQLGSSSVTYEVGIFEVPARNSQPSSSLSSSHATSTAQLPNDALAAVITRVTHVFVDRKTRRPLKPMPKQLHDGLARLKVDEFLISRETDPVAKL